MYELIVVSLLMRFPHLHGYRIAKIANDMLGPWAKLSNGTLYPLLTKLAQAGLLVEGADHTLAPPTERHARTFSLTEAGRVRFHHLMLDTASNLGDYAKLFHYKVAFLDLVPHAERAHLLNHYITYCQTAVLYMRAEAANLAHELPTAHGSPAFRAAVLEVLEHKAQQWHAELAWATQLQTNLSLPTAAPATAPPPPGTAADEQE